MKKSCVYILLMFLSLYSCQKGFLTRDNPTSTTDDQWWSTDAELLSALANLYTQVPSGTMAFAANGNMYVSFDAETDNAEWHANFFSEINIVAQGNATPDIPQEQLGIISNAILPLWREDYIMIRDANRFLENAGKAYDDSSLIKRYLAEARALRAWYHLDLFLYYGGNIPIVTSSVTPDDADLMPADSTQVIDFITKELDTCASILPVSYPSINDRYRITKGACLTMEAWAFLNAHMYQQAAAVAKRVIDLGVYQLYYTPSDSTDSYLNLFTYTGADSKEAIFLSPNNPGCYGRCAPASAEGTTNLSPTASLVNEYETKQGKTLAELGPDSMAIYEANPNYNNNRDPRLSGTILYPGESYQGVTLDPFNTSPANVDRLNAINSTVTGYWMRKYVDPQDRGNPYGSSLEFMVFRYADVLLMYVEAQVESGNWSDPLIIQYLNAIRHRAGMPDVNVAEYSGQEKLRELYQRERRVELAFEGSRLFDIRRWNIGQQVMNGSVYGATDPSTNQPVLVESRTFSAKNNLWPIPAQEITANPNMKQNPGY